MTTPHPPAGTPSDTPTPETDAQIEGVPYQNRLSPFVPAHFARTLERQRDSALAELARVKEALGIAERAMIHAGDDLAQLRADLAAAQSAVDALRGVMDHSVWPIRENYKTETSFTKARAAWESAEGILEKLEEANPQIRVERMSRQRVHWSGEPCEHKEHRAFGRRHRECTNCGHIWEPDTEE